MRQYSTQLAALMVVCGISFCSAGEKKCPPEGVELKPVNLNSVEEYEPLFHPWTRVKCHGESFCHDISCWEHTLSKADGKVYFNGSWYNERSKKAFATTAYFTLKKPGVFEGKYEHDEFDGKFDLLLVKEDVYIAAGCLKNNEFFILVNGKKDSFDPNEERLIEETLAKNNLNMKIKRIVNKDCKKKKAGL